MNFINMYFITSYSLQTILKKLLYNPRQSLHILYMKMDHQQSFIVIIPNLVYLCNPYHEKNMFVLKCVQFHPILFEGD
jgi:hypothetical protein